MQQPSGQRLLLPLLLTLIAAWGCGADPGHPALRPIHGAWRWIGSTGGIAGTRMDPASEGFNATFYFHRDGSVDVYRDDKRQDHTPLTAAKLRAPDGRHALVLRYADPLSIFPFDLGIRRQTLRRTAQDTLVLSDPCCDRYDHTLVRID